MRVRTLGRNGLDASAVNQLIIQIGIGFGQKEGLPRIHPGFRGLDVTIEVARGFGLHIPMRQFGRHRDRADAQGQNP